MDFKETWRVYTELKEQFDQGRLSADNFEKRVNEMTVTDVRGDLWQIGVSSGKWYRYDGQNWVEDMPFNIIQPPVLAAPVETHSSSFKWLWIGGGLAGLALVGCAAVAIMIFFFNQNEPLPNNTVVPQPVIATQPLPVLPQPATETPISSGPIAGPGFDPNSPPFFDDFSNPASGWNRERTADYVRDYENGNYRIQVNKTKWALMANPNKNFAGEVIVEVDAAKVGGPDKNGFGVICRYQDENNYYRFMISSDGLMVISMKKNGAWSNLSSDVWEPSNAINLGSASNHIRAECIGDSLKLLVNDQLAASASDSSFTSGDVGLIASAYDIPGVDILFDNFSASSR